MSIINMNIKLTGEVINRFLYYFRVIKEKDPNKHWLWVYPINSKGYGTFYYKYTTFYAHRVSYLYHNNMIQSPLFVLHKIECSNKSCVNPNHLYLGTNQDNMNDAIKTKTHNFTKQIGINNPNNTILTEELVLKIRFEAFAYNFTCRYLAQKYKVSKSTINYILTYKIWKHI